MRRITAAVGIVLAAAYIVAVWQMDELKPFAPETRETAVLRAYYPAGLAPYKDMCGALVQRDFEKYDRAAYWYAYMLERDVNVDKFAGMGWPVPPNAPTLHNHLFTCTA